jgi:hypothetical protein
LLHDLLGDNDHQLHGLPASFLAKAVRWPGDVD